ncbi:TetR/AcrR family transcriptional regulator [Corynebacterium heidelbergense]|uniref:HTH tetR-type domain-containing protein n=1 Tax=Corynebacterium heidelbergense TaxID=2055947 RepID=A0A364V5A5_9CORY|nr:TetR/AcrR family transcriptional regulator [Corynebacterium heidelbergense]RAV31825.1 hypothetical protein DLJ54_06290 [Corynebacterium heidelbergense]
MVDSAIELLDSGNDAPSVAVIAKAAGVPRSVVYRLFGSREDLEESIRVSIIDGLMTELAPALEPSDSIRSLIHEATTTYVGWVAVHPDLHRFLTATSASASHGEHPMSTAGSQAVERTKQLIASNLAGIAAVAIQAGSPKQEVATLSAHDTATYLADALVGIFDTVVNRWISSHPQASAQDAVIGFLSSAACGMVGAAARTAGVKVNLDRPLHLRDFGFTGIQ